MRSLFSSWVLWLGLSVALTAGLVWVILSGQPAAVQTAAIAASPTASEPVPPAAAPAPEQKANGDTWVPAEFATGMARFKEAGVYVDGKIVGVLAFGELPAALKPLIIDDKVSAPKRPGDAGPGWVMKKTPRYRFTDYLRTLGLDVDKIKEIHVHGPKGSDVVIASGRELRSELGKGFMFRFGGDVTGKALPVVPLGFGNRKSPDKITAVTVYMNKVAPKLVRNVGLFLNDEPVEGIAYYGEPMRGGVRIYLDDKLAHVIKRRQLADAAAGETGSFSLSELLAPEGVDMSTVVEGWIIAQDKRTHRLDREALASAVYQARSKQKSVLEVNGEKLRLDALALHTKPVPEGTYAALESVKAPSAEPEEIKVPEPRLTRFAGSR